MAFTASHYLEVARIIREERAHIAQTPILDARGRHVSNVAVVRVAGRLCSLFARQNPKFDAARFARDCTPEG